MAQLCCNEAWHNRKYCSLIFAFSWTAGLLGGMQLYSHAGICDLAWMCRVYGVSVSVPGQFCVYFLPFLFTVCAVFAEKRGLIYIIGASKAVLYGFVIQAISAVYGSAGWLVRGVVLFCDSAWMLWLYVFWQRMLSARKCLSIAGVVCGVMLCVVLSALDCCVISPFSACLINI